MRDQRPVSPRLRVAARVATVTRTAREDPVADALEPSSHEHCQPKFDDEDEHVGHLAEYSREAPITMVLAGRRLPRL
jgi:hypothetical protein